MKKLILMPIIFGLAGCGTILSSTMQDIQVASNVRDARVFVDGSEYCKTPCVVQVNRASRSVIITAKKEGFEDSTIALSSSLNRMSLLNFTFLGLWTTDFIIGGVWEYTRNSIYFDLQPTGMGNKEKEAFNAETKIKRFILFNWESLQTNDDEALQSLSLMTDIQVDELRKIIAGCSDEFEAIQKTLKAINTKHLK